MGRGKKKRKAGKVGRGGRMQSGAMTPAEREAFAKKRPPRGAGRAPFVIQCGKVRRAREKEIADALVEGLPIPDFKGETIKEQARRELLEERTKDRSALELKTRAAMRHAEKTGQSVNVNTVNLIYSSGEAPGVGRLDLDDEAFAKLLEGYEASPGVKAVIQRERARAILARSKGLQKLLRKLKGPNPSAYVIAEAKRRGLLG